MPAERCEPPDGTPAGTVCVLQIGGGYMHAAWTGQNWHRSGSSVYVSPEKLGRDGWRFVYLLREKAGE